MSIGETIFLFLLALLVFGPKKLPEIARQVGKVLNEFRKASNEFRTQIEAEISHIDAEHNSRKVLPASEPPGGAVTTLTVHPEASSIPELTSINVSEQKDLPAYQETGTPVEGTVVRTDQDLTRASVPSPNRSEDGSSANAPESAQSDPALKASNV
jgi:sec-independent protein translocase protein TatB